MQSFKTIKETILRLWYPEKWKPIKGYEGLYEISSYGRVKSYSRRKGIILAGGISGSGYRLVVLHKNNKQKAIMIHLLVFDHFGQGKRNSRKLQIDHQDNNKLNNRIDNLQLVTPRENITKYHKTKKSSSMFTGVYWDKQREKWRVGMWVNGRTKYLGRFVNEQEAHIAYQYELDRIKYIR